MKDGQCVFLALLTLIGAFALATLPGAPTGICVFTEKGPIHDLAIHYNTESTGTTDGTGCFSYSQLGGLVSSTFGGTTDFSFIYNGTGYDYPVLVTHIITVTMK